MFENDCVSNGINFHTDIVNCGKLSKKAHKCSSRFSPGTAESCMKNRQTFPYRQKYQSKWCRRAAHWIFHPSLFRSFFLYLTHTYHNHIQQSGKVLIQVRFYFQQFLPFAIRATSSFLSLFNFRINNHNGGNEIGLRLLNCNFIDFLSTMYFCTLCEIEGAEVEAV